MNRKNPFLKGDFKNGFTPIKVTKLTHRMKTTTYSQLEKRGSIKQMEDRYIKAQKKQKRHNHNAARRRRRMAERAAREKQKWSEDYIPEDTEEIVIVTDDNTPSYRVMFAAAGIQVLWMVSVWTMAGLIATWLNSKNGSILDTRLSINALPSL